MNASMTHADEPPAIRLVQLRLDPELVRDARIVCAMRGMALAAYITQLVRAAVDAEMPGVLATMSKK